VATCLPWFIPVPLSFESSYLSHDDQKPAFYPHQLMAVARKFSEHARSGQPHEEKAVRIIEDPRRRLPGLSQQT
jgi:hypothetical protein